MLSFHNGIELEITNKKRLGKSPNIKQHTSKLNMHQKNLRKILKYFELMQMNIIISEFVVFRKNNVYRKNY